MRKFASSLVLAVAVIGLPAVFTSMTGCSGDSNEATQIEGVEVDEEPGHEEEFEKQQAEDEAAGGDNQ